MEVEAKFAIPDVATYARLQEAGELAGYALQHRPAKEDHDRYLDTRDRRFLIAGYFCRLRSEDGGYLITLKSLGDAGGAIHRRDEREVKLAEPDFDPAHWPDSPATWLAQEIARQQPLQPLFDLRQARAKRLVVDGERQVGELTVDAVELEAAAAGSEPLSHYYELEIELKDQGTEPDLERLSAELQNAWGLRPEPRSKFERASTILGLDRPPQPTLGDALAPYEQSALEEYAQGPRIWARRAAAVLGWASGQPTREVAGNAGLSTGRVRFWVRAWRGRRLDIFARNRRAAPGAKYRAVTQEGERGMGGQSNQDGVDTRRAEETRAADVAEENAAQAAVVVAGEQQAGAGVAAEDQAAAQGTASVEGEQREPGVTAEAQAPAQGGAAQGDDRAASARGGDAQRSDDQAASATTGGDVSAKGQEPDRGGLSEAPGEAAPAVSGPAESAPAAAEAEAQEEPEPLAWLKQPVAPDDPMAEAGRKIMHIHFQRMCENEEGTRSGEDTENLHDMRVSTRRLRAAYLLFEPYFDSKAFGQFNKQLRKTGRNLGAVRDLDVLIEKAEHYQEEHKLPAPGLEPLAHAWHEKRDRDRADLIDYLDSKRYRSFTEDFEQFLTTPGAGARPIAGGEPVAYEVRHVVPRLIMGRYEDVRAYERLLPNSPLATYHQLRITCKKLRYAMEFFRDVMGNGAGALIKQVVAMQDLLGNLHDASVAEGLIAEFLAQQARDHAQAVQQEPLEGVAAYLAAQWTIQRQLLSDFTPLWKGLTGYDFRRSLSLALAEM